MSLVISEFTGVAIIFHLFKHNFTSQGVCFLCTKFNSPVLFLSGTSLKMPAVYMAIKQELISKMDQNTGNI